MAGGHSRQAKLFMAAAGVVAALHLAWTAWWLAPVVGAGLRGGWQSGWQSGWQGETAGSDPAGSDPLGEPVTFEEHARASVPPLIASIPADGSVLVVSGVIDPVPFDFYLLPRVTRLLAAIEPLRLAALEAKRLYPTDLELAKQVWWVEERYRRLQAKGQIWTVEDAERALASTDYVLTFAVQESILGPFLPRLHEVHRDGHAVLFRVGPPK